MAVQLKFCLVGAAGAIAHRNPRSSKWEYQRLLQELESAYSPSSDHAAAVAVELRQRIRQAGEALHVFRDDIYRKVAVAYGDRSEREQDAVAVEVFTNGLGDADIIQKLLETRPSTLARAYEIAHRHETTKRAASYVTSIMQPGARNLNKRRPCTAVVRETEAAPATPPPDPAPNWGPGDLGRTSLVQHDILTRPGAPVKQPPRRLAVEKQQDADRQIGDTLKTGLASRSHSSWASPIVMWHPEHQAAFDTLKRLLTTAPVLGYPLDQGEMVLDTDASDTGIGAVLSQMQDGAERVLA
uniref:Reverse transcriptase/retrotransposon-derived protein RNase H-like domain-containing protein n=1 Tax=Knipowitschia caucasica TaxID=637954 RepID=A0AAV2LF77_KNICA